MPGSLNGKTVAVTGAAGFIGGRLVDRLTHQPVRIVRVTRTPPPSCEAGAASVIDVIGDVGDRGIWDQLVTADVIVHLAAQTSGTAAADGPLWDVQPNVAPMRHLLDACRATGRRPMVLFAGTVTQVGVPIQLPVGDDAPDDPITSYDRHKLWAEADLTGAVERGAARGATLRLANVYGPGAPGRGADRDVLNRMIRAAIDGRPLTVYGSGEYVRDYVFIDDVVDAFLMAAARPDRVNGGHFVVGSGQGVTIRQAFELVAARVELATGRPVPVTTIEPPAPLSAIERRHFVADPSRFSSATGWRPRWSLSEGIDRTIQAWA